MSPPAMKHLYLDNFWRDMGQELGSLRYLDDVIIEHMHFLIGKSEQDAGYAEVNSSEIGRHDQLAYLEYTNTGFAGDAERLRNN